MKIFLREQRSLFGEILDWMLTPLLLLWPVSLALTWLVAQGLANKPFDRALEYNAHALAQLVSVVGDKAQVANTLARQSLENTVLYFDINGDPYRETAEMAPADMTADQVVDNHLTAIGGRPAIEKVKDVRKEYAATVQGMEVVLLEQQLVPDQYAMEMTMGSMVLQKLVYNTGAGFIDGPDGRRELMDQELADARESAAPFAEANYKAMGHQLTLTGVVEVDFPVEVSLIAILAVTATRAVSSLKS